MKKFLPDMKRTMLCFLSTAMKRTMFCFMVLFYFHSSFFILQAQDYARPSTHNYTRPYTTSGRDSLRFKKMFFSFNAGVAVPEGEYASRDTAKNFMILGPPDSTDGKGFANIGFHFNLNGGIFITPHFGIIAKAAFDYNTFDEIALNSSLGSNLSYTIDESYHILQYMFGIFGRFNIDNTSFIWVQGTVGLINANFPSFTGTVIYNKQAYLYTFSLDNANVFAYSLGFGLEKEIHGPLSFILNASYTGSELSYPTMTYNRYYTSSYTQNTPVTMSFGSIDITMGLLFHL